LAEALPEVTAMSSFAGTPMVLLSSRTGSSMPPITARGVRSSTRMW
jgi:hypothetical protein